VLRLFAILFGIAFIFAGVSGFVPQFNQDGLLFGYFEVNFMHNVVHIVSGVIAIMSATSHNLARLFFQIFGVLYAIVAIAGFALDGDLSLIMMHVNMADNILHTVIAVVALYAGFTSKKQYG
jgi:hypothetical protein